MKSTAQRLLDILIGNNISHAGKVLLAGLTISLFASLGVLRLEFSFGHRVYFDHDNPHMVTYEEIQATYSKSDNILFLLELPSDQKLFIPRHLAAVHWLTEQSWQLPYSQRVDSITNFQHSTGSEDDIVVQGLIEDPLSLSQSSLEKRERYALGEPEIVHRLYAENGRSTIVNVTLNLPENDNSSYAEAEKAANDLRTRFNKYYPDISIHQAGYVPLFNAFVNTSVADMEVLMPLVIIAIALVLQVFLRSIAAVSSILITALLSIGTTMGLVCWLGIPINGTTAATPIIILTIAVANTVHLVNSYQQSLYQYKSKALSIEKSLRANILPISITALTTIVGFLSLNFSEAPPFRAMGNIAAFGVFVAMLFSLTLTPCFLLLADKSDCKRPRSMKLMSILAARVFSKHKLIFACFLATSLLAMTFIPENDYNDQFEEFFDEKLPFRQAMDAVNRDLGGTTTIEFAISHADGLAISSPDFLDQIDRLSTWMKTYPGVHHVVSVSDTIKRLNQTFHQEKSTHYRLPATQLETAQLLLLYEMSLPLGLSLTDRLNLDKTETRIFVTLKPMDAKTTVKVDQAMLLQIKENFPSLKAKSSSIALTLSYMGEENGKNMVLGSVLALIIVSALLTLSLRSVRLGIVSLIPNLLPAGVAFGIWGAFIQDINIGVSAALGMTMGLIVDDTVHFLTKYQRETRKEQSLYNALLNTFEQVGPALVITSVALLIGFLVLSQSLFKLNAHVGLFTALTIFLALLCVLTMLPSILLIAETIQVKRKQKQHKSSYMDALPTNESDELIFVEQDRDITIQDLEIKIYAQEIVDLNSRSNGLQLLKILPRIETTSNSVLFPRNFVPQLRRAQKLCEFERATFLKLLDMLSREPYRYRNAMFHLSTCSETLSDKSFLEFASAAVKSRKLSPGQFCFEFSNTQALGEPAVTELFAEKAKRKGFSLAMQIDKLPDKRLNICKHFQIDFLKFRAMYMEIAKSHSDTDLCLKILTRNAASSGFKLIATNVDRASLKELASNYQIHLLQGYELATPVDLRWTPLNCEPSQRTVLNSKREVEF